MSKACNWLVGFVPETHLLTQRHLTKAPPRCRTIASCGRSVASPVRKDYQLSEKAQKSTTHVNVYDPKDPVQSNGGNSMAILPDNPSSTKYVTGEYGTAGRTFPYAKQNIPVDNPQGFINGLAIDGGVKWGDYHNSHNRVNDWIKKTE